MATDDSLRVHRVGVGMLIVRGRVLVPTWCQLVEVEVRIPVNPLILVASFVIFSRIGQHVVRILGLNHHSPIVICRTRVVVRTVSIIFLAVSRMRSFLIAISRAMMAAVASIVMTSWLLAAFGVRYCHC